MEAFGAVHVLVANAGILRDKSFMGMDEKMWDQVIAVHLRGTYRVRLSAMARVSSKYWGKGGLQRPGQGEAAVAGCEAHLRKLRDPMFVVACGSSRPRRVAAGAGRWADGAVLQGCLAPLSEAEIWTHHHDCLAQRYL